MPRFIPARFSHLVQEVTQDLPSEQQSGFWDLARLVEDLYHHYGAAQSRLADELYAPFDPDLDTAPQPPVPHSRPVERLFERLAHLFERANFCLAGEDELLRRSDVEVLRKLDLEPDLAAIERLAVYYRGTGTRAQRIRMARRLFRLEEVEVPTFRRVAIVVRTRDDPEVRITLFKDVPAPDLELLLPTVRLRMRLLDKLKLSGSGGAAVVSAWKLIRAAYTYAPWLTKFLALPFKVVLLPILLIVGGVYGGKTYLDYSRIRASYITALAQHLYAITLATNRAALGRVAQLAGEEDAKEVVLAYGLLLQAGPGGLSPDELQARAEAFVWERYRARVTFDLPDALAKLDELAIGWRGPDGRLSAVALEAALRSVDQAWDELYAAPRAARRAGGAEGTPEAAV